MDTGLIAAESLLVELMLVIFLMAALRSQEVYQARDDGLRAQRSALQDLVRRGLLSDRGYEELMSQIDEQRARLEEREE